jgi:hypothetical protein
MLHRVWLLGLPIGLLAAGCVFDEPKAALVPATSFVGGAPVAPGLPVSRANYPPAPLESAARVDTVGMQLLAANKEIGLQPQFRTIGAPQLEVFHYGTSNILITEGLVKACATDGQLAAVLARELAKMVAEREALAAPETRRPERLPPMDVRVGNDNGGGFGPSSDQTHLAELGKYEKERKHQDRPLTGPDPDALARGYLTKAGFAPADLDATLPTLQSAAQNTSFARQLKVAPSPQARNWTR